MRSLSRGGIKEMRPCTRAMVHLIAVLQLFIKVMQKDPSMVRYFLDVSPKFEKAINWVKKYDMDFETMARAEKLLPHQVIDEFFELLAKDSPIWGWRVFYRQVELGSTWLGRILLAYHWKELTFLVNADEEEVAPCPT